MKRKDTNWRPDFPSRFSEQSVTGGLVECLWKCACRISVVLCTRMLYIYSPNHLYGEHSLRWWISEHLEKHMWFYLTMVWLSWHWGVQESILSLAVDSGEIKSLPCISVPFQALPVFCFKLQTLGEQWLQRLIALWDEPLGVWSALDE